jgi:hypothetical protein
VTIPCFGPTGSSFAKAGCSTAVPAACVSAAASEATGLINPSAAATGNNVTTGTQSLEKLGCYMAGNTVIVPPALGTFGTMQRNELRTQPFREWDMALLKTTKIKESLSAQFRAELFNVTNSEQYGAPNLNLAAPTSFGEAGGTPNSANTLIGTGGPRVIQFALKLLF